MATIRRRGERYQVMVRRTGFPPQSKTFQIKRDAELWARETERGLELGSLLVMKQSSGLTLADLLVRYRDEVTAAKKGARQEAGRINRLLRSEPLTHLSLVEITTRSVNEFKARRTVRSKRAAQFDLLIMRHAVRVARRIWGVTINHNPFDEVAIPNGVRRRDRRLEQGEYEKLVDAAFAGQVAFIEPLIRFAIATGMRRSEILSCEACNVDQRARTLLLKDTKNGDARLVPLSSEAIRLIADLPQEGRLFPVTETQARQAWERVRQRAGIVGLRFHDLRREAISRFFEAGLSVPEVAVISGHKTPSQLFVYTKLRAVDVAAKLG